MTRRGRKRLPGPRTAKGRHIQPKGETPLERAAGMPHRRALNGMGADPLGESELGRLALLGHITQEQYIAGQHFLRLLVSYLSVIGGPRQLGVHGGWGGSCTGETPCLRMPCRCDWVQDAYLQAVAALKQSGPSLCERLDALAAHFGLTRRTNCRNINSRMRPGRSVLPT
jgi:hypothetical protein